MAPKYLIRNDFDNRDAGVVFVTLVDTIFKVGEVPCDAASGQNECEVEGKKWVTHSGLQRLSMSFLSL